MFVRSSTELSLVMERVGFAVLVRLTAAEEIEPLSLDEAYLDVSHYREAPSTNLV